MRLLHTETLQLKEFFGKDIPPYAALSHTWEESQEVSFQEFQNPTEDVKKRSGYTKILEACRLSYRYGFQYIWIDTCCINKDSSAELSEAINSMYEYYRNAVVCYAYLEDVYGDEDPRAEGSQFRSSKWFARGWTLQELLAPSRLIFFAAGWVDIGTRSSLEDIITAETGIPSSALNSLSSLQDISVAQKMSWAAKRETSREEDLAYCLMGIVGVNMPTLYGEGGVNAFMRLQEEIIKRSADQSIFAWKANKDDGTRRGLLAHSPSEFVSSGRVHASRDRDTTTYSMTNRGLCIKLPLIPLDDELSACLDGRFEKRDLCFAVFDCQLEGRDHDQALGIYLERVIANQFVRVKADRIVLGHKWSKVSYLKQEIYVKDPEEISALTLEPKKKSSWTVVTTSGNIFGIQRPESLCSLTHSMGLAEQSKTRNSSDYMIVQMCPELRLITWLSPYEDAQTKGQLKGSRQLTVAGIVLDEGKTAMMKLQSIQNECEVFIVVFGREGQIWTDILTEEEWKSRKTSHCRGLQGVDRVGRSLKVTERTSVSVALKKFHKDDQYLVEIDIREKTIIPYTTARLPPPLKYGFAVKVEALDLPFDIVATVFPVDIWSPTRNKRMDNIHDISEDLFLPVPNSQEPGIIFFREKEQFRAPLFAVVIGVVESRTWATVVSKQFKSSDCIENICICQKMWQSLKKTTAPDSPRSANFSLPSTVYLSTMYHARQIELSVKENTELDQLVTHRAVIKICV
ncbi:hypothetical protein VKT23_002914 [Stygiomarasmius scandens]|uniref:HET-domain-containing protein n=1 Tax=Marasmiellus scandens TaxID=2682957 RepID=A0ABR1JWF1_9AGAR